MGVIRGASPAMDMGRIATAILLRMALHGQNQCRLSLTSDVYCCMQLVDVTLCVEVMLRLSRFYVSLSKAHFLVIVVFLPGKGSRDQVCGAGAIYFVCGSCGNKCAACWR